MTKAAKTSAPVWGMILYTILEDGGLSGIWTNRTKTGDNVQGRRRELFTEIARKNQDNIADLSGQYRSAWIDNDPDETVAATLAIAQNGTFYTFVWSDAGTTLFTGVGMRLGIGQLVVTYWSGGSPQFQLPG